MKTICVAQTYINIESADEKFFSLRFKDYECSSVISPDMTIISRLVDTISIPKGELCFQKGDTFLLKLNDGKYCRYLKNIKSNSVYLLIKYTTDYAEIEINILKDFETKQLTTTDIEYMYTGFMFANRLAVLGGTVLHSSSLSFDGQGILFSANSGTGKSTHVNLWKKQFGNRVNVINDDKPAIRIIDGKPYVFGTPWSGKTSLNQNIMCPLKAIIFLSRGVENSISKMDITYSVLNLSQQLPNPFYDEKIGIKAVQFIEKIYKAKIPIYDLRCNISPNAVEVVYNELFKGEN